MSRLFSLTDVHEGSTNAVLPDPAETGELTIKLSHASVPFLRPPTRARTIRELS